MKFPKSVILFILAIAFLGGNVYCWFAERMTSILSFISFMIVLLTGYLFFESLQAGKKTNRVLLVSSLLIAVIIAEVGLRLFAPSLRCYAERNGSFFYSSATNIYLRDCNACTGKDYFINDPNSSKTKNGMEFNYMHRYDQYGLRNDSMKNKGDTNEIRIIGIGDSFTEGVGAPADSSWVKLLEDKCNKDSLHYVSAINAGVQGCDLIFSLHLLKECLLKSKPDVVLLNLNSTDINDILTRGGMNRFDANGNFHMKPTPSLEYPFGSSFLVRFFMLHYLGYNWQVITNEQQKEEERASFASIIQAINEYQTLSKVHQFKFILVLQPLHYELFDKNIFEQMPIDTAIHKIDLYPVFRQKIVVDKEPVSDYYWPVDGHFKSKGYEVIADQIYKANILDK